MREVADEDESGVVAPKYGWYFLVVIVFIVAGGVGNILVCLAVCLDKRLQNVTNYFLLSLAIADLLVSLFVMPLGAIPGFFGEWYKANATEFSSFFGQIMTAVSPMEYSAIRFFNRILKKTSQVSKFHCTIITYFVLRQLNACSLASCLGVDFQTSSCVIRFPRKTKEKHVERCLKTHLVHRPLTKESE